MLLGGREQQQHSMSRGPRLTDAAREDACTVSYHYSTLLMLGSREVFCSSTGDKAAQTDDTSGQEKHIRFNWAEANLWTTQNVTPSGQNRDLKSLVRSGESEHLITQGTSNLSATSPNALHRYAINIFQMCVLMFKIFLSKGNN